MINLKTKEDIVKMQKGGKILAEVLNELSDYAKVGVSELDLDTLAEKLIIEKGGEPGFKKVQGYKNTICVSTNDVVVHGIPTDYKFKEGDVVGIDCGVYYEGFNTDMAETIKIKNEKLKIKNEKDINRFLEIGKKALWAGIKQAKVGNRVGHISKTIQNIVEEKGGYSVVRSLVGHGVGKYLHEDPEIPGFLDLPLEKTPLLKEGMTIAIEVIYNMGTSDVVYANSDGWTIKTMDKSISGLFEKTVAITKNGPTILTRE